MRKKEWEAKTYDAEFVNVCAAPRTFLIFRTFFFYAARWNREGNKISPHKTSRSTLFKEITWCVLQQRDNVVFMQTSSSKAAVQASGFHTSCNYDLQLGFCACVCVCVRVRNATPFSPLKSCAKQNETFPLSVRSHDRSDSQRRGFHEISIFFTKIYGTFEFHSNRTKTTYTLHGKPHAF